MKQRSAQDDVSVVWNCLANGSNGLVAEVQANGFDVSFESFSVLCAAAIQKALRKRGQEPDFGSLEAASDSK